MKHSHPIWKNVILMVGVLLVSINLRPAITAVGALAERLHSGGLSLQEIGALTTIPLILFGLVGMGAGWVGSRIGFARALGIGLLLLAAGCWIRSMDTAETIVWRILGTILIGSGIALGNVLLPGIVKSRFPDHVGLLTSLYSTALNLGAAFGVAFAIPLADALPGGWSASLSAWAWLAIVSFLIWAPQMRIAPAPRPLTPPLAGLRALARERRAWVISAHMGLQSMVFYSVISWLPTVLQSRGMEESVAAYWVTAMQLLGCVSSLVIPTLAGRRESQSGWIFGCAMTSAVSLMGVLLLPSVWTGLAVLTLGLGLNASFGLCLLILALRSDDAETTAHLSAMAQGTGYLLAAPGPWLIGIISATAGGWNAAVGAIALVAVITAFLGISAGRKGRLHAAPEKIGVPAEDEQS